MQEKTKKKTFSIVKSEDSDPKPKLAVYCASIIKAMNNSKVPIFLGVLLLCRLSHALVFPSRHKNHIRPIYFDHNFRHDFRRQMARPAKKELRRRGAGITRLEVMGVTGQYLDSVNRLKYGNAIQEPALDPDANPNKGRAVFFRRMAATLISLLLVLSVSRSAGAIAAVSDVDTAAAAASTTASLASATTSATTSVFSRVPAPLASAFWEIRISLRLIFAALTGAAIGKERSGKYHPAGVRTMSLVALGAALFTLCSRHGFAGTHYDTSRMASNVASGVGFIGAGVIYHEQKSDKVHGLTTAAAIWISAAVGVACGAGLYVVASMSTFLTLAILRIGGAVKLRRRGRRAKKQKRHEKQQHQQQLQLQQQQQPPPSTQVRQNRQKPEVPQEDSLEFPLEYKIKDELVKQLVNSTDWSDAGDEKMEMDLFLKNLKETWNDDGSSP